VSVAEVTASAPATVSNLGPGFDLLGLALAEPRDLVTARLVGPPGIRIVRIEGDGGRLPLEADRNTAGIAATATLARAGIDAGIELVLEKGMPIGSGLGSSAASAAAAAYAVNALLGSPLPKHDLVAACLDAEAAVSGRHADNIAPSLLGGLVLVRSTDPLELLRLPVPDGLEVVVVKPDIVVETRAAREALPEQVPLQDAVTNASHLATFIAACFSGDLGLLADSIEDVLAAPFRIPLVPGCEDVMAAARSAGALGTSLSGSGPSIFALCHAESVAARVRDAMVDAFATVGLAASGHVSPADCPGARVQ